MSWASVRQGSAALLLLACCCGPEKPARARAIGEAFVAPETLDLRKEIALDSGVVGTAKRGERVEILQQRRRFARVRTAGDKEGWTEQGRLLTPELSRQIAELAKQAAARPTQGAYRARDTLNVHLEPYRWSQSIYQLKEEESAEMVGRRVVERTAGPKAPPPPADKPRQYDEWCLMRTASGSAGWVLARMMDAGIPDEVAQYAEGRRITSYFPLAEVTDGKQVKKVWLWTTIERQLDAHDFDSIRVFNWGRRRHRYETSHIERGLKGFFPVVPAERVETRFGAGPGFSLLVEKKDGKRYTRRYVMLGHIVRLYAEEPATAP